MPFTTHDKVVVFLNAGRERNRVCAFHGLQTLLVHDDYNTKVSEWGRDITIEVLESGIYWMGA